MFFAEVILEIFGKSRNNNVEMTQSTSIFIKKIFNYTFFAYRIAARLKDYNLGNH